MAVFRKDEKQIHVEYLWLGMTWLKLALLNDEINEIWWWYFYFKWYY